jgi:hypothetical protein
VAIVSLGAHALDSSAQNAMLGALAAGHRPTAFWVGDWDGPEVVGEWEGCPTRGLGGHQLGRELAAARALSATSWWRYRDRTQWRAAKRRLEAQRLRLRAEPSRLGAARVRVGSARHTLRSRSLSVSLRLGRRFPRLAPLVVPGFADPASLAQATRDDLDAALGAALVAAAPDVIQVLDLELAPAAEVAQATLGHQGRRPKLIFQPRHFDPASRPDGPTARAARAADLVVTPGQADLARLEKWRVATPALCVAPAQSPQVEAPGLTARGLAGPLPSETLAVAWAGGGWPWAPLTGLDLLEDLESISRLVFFWPAGELGRLDAAGLVRAAQARGVAERLAVVAPPPPHLAAAAVRGAAVGLVPWAAGARDLAVPLEVGHLARAGVPMVVSLRAAKVAEAVLKAGAGHAYDPGERHDVALAVKAALAERDRLAAELGPSSPLARLWRPEDARAIYERPPISD